MGRWRHMWCKPCHLGAWRYFKTRPAFLPLVLGGTPTEYFIHSGLHVRTDSHCFCHIHHIHQILLALPSSSQWVLCRWQQWIRCHLHACRRICCKYCASECGWNWSKLAATWGARHGLGGKSTIQRGPSYASFTMCPCNAMRNDRPCHRKAWGLFPFVACQSSPTSGLSVWNRLRDDIC